MKKIFAYLFGVVVSVAITLGLLLLFSLVVKTFSLPSAVIRPVNQVVKAAGVLVAIFISVKDKGITSGGIIGLLYGVTTNLVFGLIGGSFTVDLGFLLDLCFCLIVGIIGGILCVNLKNK